MMTSGNVFIGGIDRSAVLIIVSEITGDLNFQFEFCWCFIIHPLMQHAFPR